MIPGISPEQQRNALAQAIEVHRDEIRQRGGTHNAMDRRAAAWELASAGLLGGSFAALASGLPAMTRGKLPILNLGAAAVTGGGSIAAQLVADKHLREAEAVRRQQFPQLYDENGKFIKVALFVPGVANLAKRTTGIAAFKPGALSKPAVNELMMYGKTGIKGTEPIMQRADMLQNMARRNPGAQQQAGQLYRQAQTRGDRLRFVGEQQWQKPMLQAKAGLNQAVARVKNFRFPEPAARPMQNFAPAT